MVDIQVLDVPPTKILLAEVMFSNVGGTEALVFAVRPYSYGRNSDNHWRPT